MKKTFIESVESGIWLRDLLTEVLLVRVVKPMLIPSSFLHKHGMSIKRVVLFLILLGGGAILIYLIGPVIKTLSPQEKTTVLGWLAGIVAALIFLSIIYVFFATRWRSRNGSAVKVIHVPAGAWGAQQKKVPKMSRNSEDSAFGIGLMWVIIAIFCFLGLFLTLVTVLPPKITKVVGGGANQAVLVPAPQAPAEEAEILSGPLVGKYRVVKSITGFKNDEGAIVISQLLGYPMTLEQSIKSAHDRGCPVVWHDGIIMAPPVREYHVWYVVTDSVGTPRIEYDCK